MHKHLQGIFRIMDGAWAYDDKKKTTWGERNGFYGKSRPAMPTDDRGLDEWAKRKEAQLSQYLNRRKAVNGKS